MKGAIVVSNNDRKLVPIRQLAQRKSLVSNGLFGRFCVALVILMFGLVIPYVLVTLYSSYGTNDAIVDDTMSFLAVKRLINPKNLGESHNFIATEENGTNGKGKNDMGDMYDAMTIEYIRDGTHYSDQQSSHLKTAPTLGSINYPTSTPQIDQGSMNQNLPHRAKFAYLYVIDGCKLEVDFDPQLNATKTQHYQKLLYNAMITKYLLQQSNSTSDVMVLIQMDASSNFSTLRASEVALLENMRIKYRYIPKPQYVPSVPFIQQLLHSFEKLRAYNFIQYQRIMVIDNTVVVRKSIKNLDFLMQASVDGVLKENFVIRSMDESSSNDVKSKNNTNMGYKIVLPCLFMITPQAGKWHRSLQLLDQLVRIARNNLSSVKVQAVAKHANIVKSVTRTNPANMSDGKASGVIYDQNEVENLRQKTSGRHLYVGDTVRYDDSNSTFNVHWEEIDEDLTSSGLSEEFSKEWTSFQFGDHPFENFLLNWLKLEEKSFTMLDRLVVQNWGSTNVGILQMETTLHLNALFSLVGTGIINETSSFKTTSEKNVDPIKCWKGTQLYSDMVCIPPYSDFAYFPGSQSEPSINDRFLKSQRKTPVSHFLPPWYDKPPWGYMFTKHSSLLTPHEKRIRRKRFDRNQRTFWFSLLEILNEKYEIGLDKHEWSLSKDVYSRYQNMSLSSESTIDLDTVQIIDAISFYLSTQKINNKTRFAYSYVIGGCDPENPAYRNYIYDIMISTYLQRFEGSTADVVVFIQMLYKSSFTELPAVDVHLFRSMNIQFYYIPKTTKESFYRIMLDKFRVLQLTQYDRVLFLDCDVLTFGSLDYLFHLSMEQVLMDNVVFAGVLEPANGGVFLIKPEEGDHDRVLELITGKEQRGKQLPYPHWDEVLGWGHALDENEYMETFRGDRFKNWSFHGAFTDQGLLYHWVKYEKKSVSIIMLDTIQNWRVGGVNSSQIPHETNFFVSDYSTTLHETLSFTDTFTNRGIPTRVCPQPVRHRACVTPVSDFYHFTGKIKPWLVGPKEDFKTSWNTSAASYWFFILDILNQNLQLEINFTSWRKRHRPLLGMYPKHIDSISSYHGNRRNRKQI